MSSFRFDSSQFEASLQRLVRDVMPDAIKRGLGVAGMQLLNDAALETPTVPHDEGTLRGSGSVLVEGKLVGTSPSPRGKGTPATEDTTTGRPGQFVAVIGFNTPYAAYLHEGVRLDGTHTVANWTEPSSGAKYLERKLLENRDLYFQIVAGEIARF